MIFLLRAYDAYAFQLTGKGPSLNSQRLIRKTFQQINRAVKQGKTNVVIPIKERDIHDYYTYVFFFFKELGYHVCLEGTFSNNRNKYRAHFFWTERCLKEMNKI